MHQALLNCFVWMRFQVTLGPSGAETVHDLGTLSPYEEAALKSALPELYDSIEKGIKYVTG